MRRLGMVGPGSEQVPEAYHTPLPDLAFAGAEYAVLAAGIQLANEDFPVAARSRMLG